MNCEKRSIIKILIPLFVGYFFLSFLFPYMGDDWSWGSSIGIERLRIFFADYNGRYTGNLAVLVLTRCKLLKIVVMSVSFLLICFLSYQYTDDRSETSLLVAAFLYFLMPKGMWAQVAAWTAGFTNYVLSALVSVAFLVSVKEITEPGLSDRKDTPGYGVGMLAFGFVGALIMESITILNICLSAAAFLLMFVKFRKYRYTNIGFFFGSVIGACVMFSNGAYGRVVQGSDHYRYIPVSVHDKVQFAIQQCGNILDYIIYDNLWFCMIVTVLLLILAAWDIKNGTRKKCAMTTVLFHCGCMSLLWNKEAVSNIFTTQFPMKEQTAGYISSVCALLYVLSILIMVLRFVEEGRRFRMLLPLYCVVVSLAPLLIVHPIGPRCVFIGYFLMIVFTVDLFSYICKRMYLQRKWLNRLFGAAVAVQFLFYIYVFAPIYHYDTLRVDYIREQAARGEKNILMCDLPNSDYLWVSTPFNEGWVNKYKLFYRLDEDIWLNCVPYEEFDAWLENAF